jgi:hypothetical protein
VGERRVSQVAVPERLQFSNVVSIAAVRRKKSRPHPFRGEAGKRRAGKTCGVFGEVSVARKLFSSGFAYYLAVNRFNKRRKKQGINPGSIRLKLSLPLIMIIVIVDLF